MRGRLSADHESDMQMILIMTINLRAASRGNEMS